MARQVTEDELEKEYRRYKADLGAAGNPNVVDQTTYVKQRDYTVVPRPKRPDVDFNQINAGLYGSGWEPPPPPAPPGMMPAHSPQQSTPASLPQTKKPQETAPAAPAAAPQSQSNVRSWGEPGQPGSGTARFSGTLPAPGSNFRNYGYDPAEARAYQQAQAPYQQIAPNAYQGSGYTFQGSGADAARFFQPVAPSAHTPQANNSTFLKYRQQELAEEAARRAQSQMPEPPIGGWQTARAVYERQMDAFNREQDRQHALELARVGNAQQAERLGLDRQRLGFDQEQARQAMDLQRAQLGLQADQNVWNRAKAMSDMEQAAVGRQAQQMQIGAQQAVFDAYRTGDPAKIAEAVNQYQALYGKAGRSNGEGKNAGGMKGQSIKFGEDDITIDENGNPILPEELQFYVKNVDNIPESVRGLPIQYQLAWMRPGFLQWKAEEEKKAAKAKK